MDLYLPSAKRPVLHVGCPFCDNPKPHIMVERVSKISLSLPSLLCTQGAQEKILPKTSYLPFGDFLQQKNIGTVFVIISNTFIFL